jgi:hypothetical protein
VYITCSGTISQDGNGGIICNGLVSLVDTVSFFPDITVAQAYDLGSAIVWLFALAYVFSFIIRFLSEGSRNGR